MMMRNGTGVGVQSFCVMMGTVVVCDDESCYWCRCTVVVCDDGYYM